MGKKGLIILLVALGVGAAVLIGALSRSQSSAEVSYCDSLQQLKGSVSALTTINLSSTTKDDIQADVDNVKSAWSDLTSAASQVSSSNRSSLDSAWNDLVSSVKAIPGGSGSVDGVRTAAQQLASAATTAAKNYDCTTGTTTSGTSTTGS